MTNSSSSTQSKSSSRHLSCTFALFRAMYVRWECTQVVVVMVVIHQVLHHNFSPLPGKEEEKERVPKVQRKRAAAEALFLLLLLNHKSQHLNICSASQQKLVVVLLLFTALYFKRFHTTRNMPGRNSLQSSKNNSRQITSRHLQKEQEHLFNTSIDRTQNEWRRVKEELTRVLRAPCTL